MRRRQSRDSCDSDAFARPRARRALTGLQGLDARPCPTPPGPSAGSVAGSCAALVTVCCGRKVALFTSLHGGHVVWSNCDFRVLSGPGELYYVPIVCTNTSRRPAELFPDLHESSRSDFGLSVSTKVICFFGFFCVCIVYFIIARVIELIRVIYGLFRTPFVINSRSRNHSRKVTQNCYHHPPDSTRIRY